MHPTRLCCSLIAFVLAAACSSPPPCRASTVTTSYVDAPLFVVGEPLTALVVSGLQVPACLEARVNGTVLDPQNDPVEGVTWKTVDSPNGFAAELTFTPRQQGPHFVTARFEPNLALVQGFLNGAERAARPVLDTLPVSTPGRCPRRHVSPLGTSWCADSTVLFGALKNARLYALNEAAGQRHTVFAGGSIWLSRDGGGVERWVERSDAGYEREPLAMLPNATVLAATETEGFGARGGRLFRYGLDGGQWATESWPLDVVVENDLAPLTVDADAGRWWWAGQGGDICRLPMRPDAGAPQCFPNIDPIVATGRDGFWTSDGGVVSFTPLDGVRRELAVPLAFTSLSTLGPFVQRQQLLFAGASADGGLRWEIISDTSHDVAWLQDDRIWFSRGTELVALPRQSQ